MAKIPVENDITVENGKAFIHMVIKRTKSNYGKATSFIKSVFDAMDQMSANEGKIKIMNRDGLENPVYKNFTPPTLHEFHIVAGISDTQSFKPLLETFKKHCQDIDLKTNGKKSQASPF